MDSTLLHISFYILVRFIQRFLKRVNIIDINKTIYWNNEILSHNHYYIKFNLCHFRRKCLEELHITSLSPNIPSSFLYFLFKPRSYIKGKRRYDGKIIHDNKRTYVFKCLKGINSIHFWQIDFNNFGTIQRFSINLLWRVLQFNFSQKFFPSFSYSTYSYDLPFLFIMRYKYKISILYQSKNYFQCLKI